jgi:hypothetical protein
MAKSSRRVAAQSSFELLVTLAFGLAILLPLVVLAFIQLASASTSLTSVEAQQAANKLSSVATMIGSEGPPSRQVAQIQMPSGVRFVYVGNMNNSVGHEIIIVISSPTGLSYVTAYTPANVSGQLGGITATGTYLVNVTATSSCPSKPSVACVYMSSRV